MKVRVKADQTGVELANVKMAMNPFDEIAVEQAIRLKEAGTASEIVVVLWLINRKRPSVRLWPWVLIAAFVPHPMTLNR